MIIVMILNIIIAIMIMIMYIYIYIYMYIEYTVYTPIVYGTYYTNKYTLIV